MASKKNSKKIVLEGPDEAKREQASRGWDKTKSIVPLTILALLLIIGGLQLAGIINIEGMLNPNSDNYLTNNLASNNNTVKCFKYSSEMATPCCTVNNGVRVSAVYALSECECPLDTQNYNYDVVFGGKTYKTCDCKCPESK
jgi:hypothetical protein